MPPADVPVKLELTWPNKDRFLLVPKDDAGKPVWVDRDHPAAAEVRLSDFVAAFGNVDDSDPYGDNLLFTGDSLDVLRVLAETPEFRAEYRGKVKLCYIDPPFNTGQAFQHYDDWMEHASWLSFMRDRLGRIQELLRPDGTLWLHLDNAEVHRMRCLLDEVFGQANYLGTVVWQRTSAKSLARSTMGTMHELILVYGASAAANLNRLYLPLDPEYVRKRYNNEDDRGPYDTGDLTATSYRPHLDSGKPWRGFDPSARRRCWAVPTGPLLEAGLTQAELDSLTMREKLDRLDEHGFIHFPPAGGFPRFKKYLHLAKGRAIGDLWTDITVINSQAVERTGFSTQKPEALIQRVIEMGSDRGDIVLDCFAGSGTTAAVADKLDRRWVTSEIVPATVATFVEPRLHAVVGGRDTGGIAPLPDRADRGFRTVHIAPSMYEVTPYGVVLADWATNGRFARAVAGQLGFEWEPDAAPLCGRRGRMRLAVFDGAVGREEALLAAASLAESERLTIVAPVVLEDAEAALADVAPGSRIRKAPRDLLRARRRRGRTVQGEAGA